MPLTDPQARDEILGSLNTAWLAGAESASLPLFFEDTRFDRPATGAYAMASVRKVESIQATLAGTDGQKRWRTFGTVTVEVFTPRGDGHVLSDALCGTARDAFRGTRTNGGVTFRRARIREAGADGTITKSIVSADFEYDEIA